MRHAVVALAMAASAAFAQDFQLTSVDITPGQTIDKGFEIDGFGCSGRNMSPQLSWSSFPSDTKSFAVTVYDPDALTGSGWWHWVVVNIPATTRQLPSNAGQKGGQGLPFGAQHVRNDFGASAWGGLCPPPGDRPHRYVFTVYALKVANLGIPAEASPAMAGYMINANQIGKASFVSTYGRPAVR